MEECTYKEPIYLDVNNLNQARQDIYKVMDTLMDSCCQEEYQSADPYFFWSAICDFALYYGDAYGSVIGNKKSTLSNRKEGEESHLVEFH